MNPHLQKLKLNNTYVGFEEEDKCWYVKHLWGDDTFSFRFDKDVNLSSLKDIELPIELNAIYHKRQKTLELIFAPQSEQAPYLTRKTTIYYKGCPFLTEFKEPSAALIVLANGFKEIDPVGPSNYRNLPQFRDYYRKDQQTPELKAYFIDKKPFNFFIKGDFESINYEFVPFCKHINIYQRYYDRKTPVIIILDVEQTSEKYMLPCLSRENDFPESISANAIDPIALDLLTIANETGSIRLKYLFYYQVIEYFAYYHLDEEINRRVSNLLKNPDILHNYNKYSKTNIEEIRDYSNNTSDKQKMIKLIGDYLSISDIAFEIQCNLNYYEADITFDGDFILPALKLKSMELEKVISNRKDPKDRKSEREKMHNELISMIADRIEKIRNVLVHIRESRENKVILPTRTNNRKLLPYLYLTRRIAEIIAMKYSI